MNKLRKLFKSAVVKNAGWLISGKVIQMLINLLVGLISARYLGPGNYGLIGYAGAYTGFFASVCTLGINSVIVKELIDHPNREGEVLGTSLGLRAGSSILSALMIMAISSVLDAREPETRVVVALCSLGVVFNIFEVFNYWFHSRLQSKRTAIASLAGFSVTAVYRIVLLILGKPVTYFAFATSLDHLCVALILIYYYVREKGERLRFSWAYGRQLLGKSCHYILSGMMIAIYAQTDKIMLKHMIDDASIGFYSTAVSVCNVWCFVLAAIINSMNPVIMQAHKESRERFMRLNRILYCIIFYVSVCVSVLFTVFGKWIIWLLYGEAYLPAVYPLRVITWYTAFSYLGVARNVWIVSENKQKYLTPIYVSAAAVNIVLNLLCIPRWGATGAAAASLAAQIVTTLVTPFFMKEIRENSVMMLDAIFFRGLKSK